MDEDRVTEELSGVKAELKGVKTRLDSGAKKMDKLLDRSIENGERITAMESTCRERHSACDDIHSKVLNLPCPTVLADTKSTKGRVNITFDQLLKFGGFVALIATCGMVAYQTGA